MYITTSALSELYYGHHLPQFEVKAQSGAAILSGPITAHNLRELSSRMPGSIS